MSIHKSPHTSRKEHNTMTEKKSAEIKTRCFPSFKMQIEDLAKEQNTTVSNLTLSLLEAYLNSQKATGQPTNTDLLMYYNTKYIITRNKIYNIISLDPNIPSHTKEKIRKELDSLALC